MVLFARAALPNWNMWPLTWPYHQPHRHPSSVRGCGYNYKLTDSLISLWW